MSAKGDFLTFIGINPSKKYWHASNLFDIRRLIKEDIYLRSVEPTIEEMDVFLELMIQQKFHHCFRRIASMTLRCRHDV